MTTLKANEATELADLARIELPPGERERFEQQLSQILTYIETLAALDVEGVPETVTHEPPDSSLRDDLPAPAWARESLLAGAPLRREDFVEVPKIVKEKSGSGGAA